MITLPKLPKWMERDPPNIWPFVSKNTIFLDHPLIFGPIGAQYGIYKRHREHRGTFEFGIAIHGCAIGFLFDYMGSWFDRKWPDGWN